jgi:hypothetical protein
VATTDDAIHLLVGTEDDADLRRVAMAARNLKRELSRARLSVSFARGEEAPPSGAKSSTALTIGSLLVSGAFSSVALQQLARVVVAYVQRGGARKVTITDGEHEIVVDGLSGKSQKALIDSWIESRRESGRGEEDS